MGVVRAAKVLRSGNPGAAVGAILEGVAVNGAVVYRPTAAPAAVTWQFYDDTPPASGPSDGDFVFGLRFSSSVAGSIVGHRVYLFGPASVTFKIWDAQGPALLSTVTANGGPGWLAAAQSPSVPLTINNQYWATWNGGVNVWGATDQTPPITAGPLTLYGTGYDYMVLYDFPNNAETRWFGNDIVFQEG